nr:MAG TPA: hypothetical protein [Caudoviricetes sp.]
MNRSRQASGARNLRKRAISWQVLKYNAVIR